MAGAAVSQARLAQSLRVELIAAGFSNKKTTNEIGTLVPLAT
jgi:hypothetical protein